MKESKKTLKIIPLGGLEEVGRNMMLFEYDKDIIVFDMGLQFPEEDMPGIDYVIPDISYLKGKEKNIRGVIITHAHYDHIGAIPHLSPKLGNPPIFSMPLTKAIIEKRQEEYDDKLNLKIIRLDSKLKLGVFKLEFFHVNHNIPDVIGTIIKTPEGIFIHTGDFKFDPHPVNDYPADFKKIKEIGKKGVTCLLSDSTGAESEGKQLSEKEIGKTIEEIFKKAKGRIIAATFSSLISRIQQIISLSEKYGRKVYIDGFSMKTNVQIAQNLKYLKVRKGTLIKNPKILENLPLNKITILCTGAQGEDKAALMRIANREHRSIQIEKDDLVIFSSSVVPGNEQTVQSLKDTLYREGARVIHYQMMDVHVGGHGKQEDLKQMIKMVKPRYFIPIHGHYYLLRLHADLAKEVGIKEKNIFVLNNGQIVEFKNGIGKITDKKVPTNYIMVDGLGVGDVGRVVLRDREVMAKDGMFVILATINSETGKLAREVDVISRGFVYMKESQKLIDETKEKVKQIVEKKASKEGTTNWAYVKDNIRDQIGAFLFQKTQRRPMVLPMVIEI